MAWPARGPPAAWLQRGVGPAAAWRCAGRQAAVASLENGAGVAGALAAAGGYAEPVLEIFERARAAAGCGANLILSDGVTNADVQRAFLLRFPAG